MICIRCGYEVGEGDRLPPHRNGSRYCAGSGSQVRGINDYLYVLHWYAWQNVADARRMAALLDRLHPDEWVEVITDPEACRPLPDTADHQLYVRQAQEAVVLQPAVLWWDVLGRRVEARFEAGKPYAHVLEAP